jgi:hypothetical protein
MRDAELLSLEADYAPWVDALLEGCQDTPTAMSLQAIVDLDFDEVATIVPPHGYGRDQRTRPSTAQTRRSRLILLDEQPSKDDTQQPYW